MENNFSFIFQHKSTKKNRNRNCKRNNWNICTKKNKGITQGLLFIVFKLKALIIILH